MYTLPSTAKALALELKERLRDINDADLAVCPPTICIPAVGEALAGSNIAWGAQNAHWAEQGAFTGENSPYALKELGCSYVIVGHSERRHIFGEPDEMVAKRLAGVLAAGLTPILCVGETDEEREEGQTENVLERQMKIATVSLDKPPELVAYEPVWAIGTGKRAEIGDVETAHRFIRRCIRARFGSEESVRVMYGGSVKPDNIAELAESEEVDGALVGGASLDADSFGQIVMRALERRKF